MLRCTQVKVFTVWLPLWLASLFVVCESRSSGNIKSALTEPGVIIGIIVGVVGVLVVLGVSILLCKLFCCKESSCCSCCSREPETYLEAGTVPIKVPTQDGHSPDNNKPISTISHDRPVTHSRQPKPSKIERSSLSRPPQYNDIQQSDWTTDDLTKKKSIWEPELERRSQDSPSLANDEDLPDNQLDSNEKPKRNKPIALPRRKLTYEADIPDVAWQAEREFFPVEQERKKRNPDMARHGREFPERRKRHFKPQHEDIRATIMEESSSEARDGREFPLLDYEPRKFNSDPSYHDHCMSRALEETSQEAADFQPPTMEYEYQEQNPYFSHPDDGSRIREKERRPTEQHREVPTAARTPFSLSSSISSAPYVPTAGRVNLAFKQESTETTV